MDERKPHFGFSHGLAVHKHAIDHMPVHSAYARFNKRCALWITKNVGSMTAFWLFTLASMTVVPSCLYAAGYIRWHSFITTFGFELLATLVLSTWLELVLMPAIMVGQNLQGAAADARAAKTFEDTEIIADRLDLQTAGGLTAIEEHLKAQDALLAQLGVLHGNGPGNSGRQDPPAPVTGAGFPAGFGQMEEGVVGDRPAPGETAGPDVSSGPGGV